MHVVTLARNAMATRFEMILCGENPVALRAAGEEALEEIERLEGQLSIFRPTSEIAHLNTRAAWEPVQISPPVFKLLQHARGLCEESGGAFDIAIAPLVRCWGFMGGSGQMPPPEDLAAARQVSGMRLVELDAASCSVHFTRPGVMLDLGAIGKGYAIEVAAGILREAGVTNAFLHGGTSTVYALGEPAPGQSWKVVIDAPASGPGRVYLETNSSRDPATPSQENPLAVVSLREESLSVSAAWGKWFKAGGKNYGHVIDPRSGEPAQGSLAAAVVLPSATETDALSTALLVRGAEGHQEINGLRPGMKTLVVTPGADGAPVVESRGL
jgi:thiamine biosynthesis lipoprotein